MLGHGPEAWHPNPEFFYKFGGGPLFDMGPYYLTALVHLLGPIQSVSASATISFPERIATSKEKYGLHIQVEVPTHVVGILNFESGPVGTLITSFDVWSHHLPRIEIYGSEGSMLVPDPNHFGGEVLVRRFDESDWRTVPLIGRDDIMRGVGVADMAAALAAKSTPSTHKASGALAQHVLDVMESLYEASAKGQRLNIESACARPERYVKD